MVVLCDVLFDWCGALDAIFALSQGQQAPAVIVIADSTADERSAITAFVRDRAGQALEIAAPGAEIASGKLCLIHAEDELELSGYRLERAARPQLFPLDALLCSIAATAGASVVGVLLAASSGAHSLGLKALKIAGGVLIAPVSAEPAFAELCKELAALADLALPPEALAERLRELTDPARSSPAHLMGFEHHLDELVTLLRVKSARNVHDYRRDKLVRHLVRRMRVRGARSPEGYLALLESEPSEAEAFAVEVASRLPAVFDQAHALEAFANAAVPKLLARRGDGTLRVWVPCCWTGEDAYAIAMLLFDALESRSSEAKVQVFATEIEQHVLAFARRAVYPASIACRFPSRFQRFFQEEGNRYRVIPRVRESILFAIHDLSHDPPFSNLSAIFAPGILSPFSPEARAELASVFHFALLPHGLLCVQSADELPQESAFFSQLGGAGSVFEARAVPPRSFSAQRARLTPGLSRFDRASKAEPPSIPQLAEKEMLRLYAPPAVVVNESNDVLHFFGNTGRYLEPSPGSPTLSLLELCAPDLRPPLRLAIQKALRTGKAQTIQTRVLESPRHPLSVRITAAPLTELRAASRLCLVVFEEDGRGAAPSLAAEASNALAAELESLIQRGQEELQSFMATSEVASQELVYANEELRSRNEELHSVNDQFAVMRKELEHANRELQCVNEELRTKIDELERANSDIRNLFESTRIVTLFLDERLNIRNFTPSVTRLFAAIASDRGRPISDIARRFEYADFEAHLSEVLRTRAPREAQIESNDGGRYLMRMLPYRGASDDVRGVVLTFNDVTPTAIVGDLGQRALASVDLESFFRDALALIRRALHVDACDVAALSSNGERLELFATAGWGGERSRGERVGAGSAARRALARRDPVLFHASDGDWPEYLRERAIVSGARVSIWTAEGQPFGLLGVYSRARRSFGNEDLALLQAIASVLTSAVQRKFVEDARLRENEAATLRRSEERLRRAERLASLGTFAAGIAHELNNPLSNIALSAEYAEKTDSPERRAKLLSNILANAQRCGRIVESVLRFARDEATRKWATEINPIIRHAVDLVKSYVGAERLTVSLDLIEPSPQIVCNPTEIEQVFVNLLRNAVEAHPACCHVRMQEQRSDDKLTLKVSDDGPGISAADRERIFDPFFSTRRSSGGTGLGLSITHRIVTGHGGNIRVLDSAGPGAAFEVELPCEGVDSKEATRHEQSLTGR